MRERLQSKRRLKSRTHTETSSCRQKKRVSVAIKKQKKGSMKAKIPKGWRQTERKSKKRWNQFIGIHDANLGGVKCGRTCIPVERTKARPHRFDGMTLTEVMCELYCEPNSTAQSLARDFLREVRRRDKMRDGK